MSVRVEVPYLCRDYLPLESMVNLALNEENPSALDEVSWLTTSTKSKPNFSSKVWEKLDIIHLNAVSIYWNHAWKDCNRIALVALLCITIFTFALVSLPIYFISVPTVFLSIIAISEIARRLHYKNGEEQEKAIKSSLSDLQGQVVGHIAGHWCPDGSSLGLPKEHPLQALREVYDDKTREYVPEFSGDNYNRT